MEEVKESNMNQDDQGFNVDDEDKGPLATAERMKECCKVCFNPYNEIQRRPRVMTCGHTFCSICIDKQMVENKLVCPTCRKEHVANSSEDFPVNYDMETCLQTTISGSISGPRSKAASSKQLESISSFLCSSRTEQCKEMENVMVEIRENRIQMQGYKSQINTWKENHLTEIEFLQNCVQQHHEVITTIDKESQDVKNASGRGDNILQDIGTSISDLNAATTNKTLFKSMEMSSYNYELAREWISDVQRNYPNSDLIIRSQKLRERPSSVMGKLKLGEWKALVAEPQCDHDSTASTEVDKGERAEEDRIVNIEEKISSLLANLESLQKDQVTQTRILQKDQVTQTSQNQSCGMPNIDLLEISKLNGLKQSPAFLIKANRIYAVQQNERETRFSRVSHDGNDVCIHTLRKDLSIPSNALFIRYEDVVKVDVRFVPRITFLDLAAEGRPLGRLRIRLIPEGNYPLNFYRLCTGEAGPSYADSRILGVVTNWDKPFKTRADEFTSRVIFGDYQYDNGTGGQSVVSGVEWKKEYQRKDIYCKRNWEAGSVIHDISRFYNNELSLQKISQFCIRIRETTGSHRSCRFGKVEDGLDNLIEAISRYDGDNSKKIIIDDCGIILPRI